jgi:hypothetical protein
MLNGSTIFTIVRGDCTTRPGHESGRNGYHRTLHCGALRGGSHVHVFSPNGRFVSFTYNDHVLHECDPKRDLRNVGVAAPYGPVTPQGASS